MIKAPSFFTYVNCCFDPTLSCGDYWTGSGEEGLYCGTVSSSQTETDLLINATDFQIGCRDVKDSLVFSQQRDAEGC